MPKRKKIRLDGFDYSSCGAYFVTLCVNDHRIHLWQNDELNCVRPQDKVIFSETGKIIENEIRKMNNVYQNVTIDKYCIMNDHIHMIIFIMPDQNGRSQIAPTLSRVIKQFKGSITKQIGYSIWQKSFYDKVIRNEKGYQEVWEYIETNPYRWIDVL